ncbi:MAG TPA: hypothetical protein VF210_04045 [Pseudomonadales bacterium]
MVAGDTRRRPHGRAVAGGVAGGLAILWAALGHDGSAGIYVLFSAATIALIASAFVRPHSYGFVALVVFLTLGFWVKHAAWSIAGIPPIEPLGDFTGEAHEWDRALSFTAVALLGLTLAKLSLYPLRMSRPGPVARVLPTWYERAPLLVWVATAMLVIAGNVLNWRYRFYQVAVHERVILPFHLNAVIVWWLTVATSMWLAVLLEFERRRRGFTRRWMILSAPILEAVVTSAVMLSRGFYLMRTLPYALVFARPSLRRSFQLSRVVVPTLAVATVLGFVISLAGASWLRLTVFPPMVTPGQPAQAGAPQAPPADAGVGPTGRIPSAAEVRAAIREIGTMVVGRWIGLEGILAISASHQQGLGLFVAGLMEDPRSGTEALFQRISKAEYKELEGFTFMTLPGIVAVLAYSGSPVIIFAGMFLAGIVVLLTERAFRHAFDNDLLCAVVGVFMANAIVQMNFPYLTAVFFIEMWGSLLILWILCRLDIGGRSADRKVGALAASSTATP